jgi:pullulanase/glycogen debranching enzyme
MRLAGLRGGSHRRPVTATNSVARVTRPSPTRRRISPRSNRGPRSTWAPTLIDGGVNFAVYSERASASSCCSSTTPSRDAHAPVPDEALRRRVERVRRRASATASTTATSVWGPNWTYDPDRSVRSRAPSTGFGSDVDAEGNRINPNKLLIDPYAKIVHRDHDWSQGQRRDRACAHRVDLRRRRQERRRQERVRVERQRSLLAREAPGPERPATAGTT